MEVKKREVVGVVGRKIVEKFSLQIDENTKIYFGESNKNHMKDTHPKDYNEYGRHIKEIIQNPDYVGVNPNDNSLEYIKDFGGTLIHIKVAVRKTKSDMYYARTIYSIKDNKIKSYLQSGHIKKI